MQEHDPARTLVFHPSARSVVYFGPFRLDLADGLLSKSGEEVRLPPRAMIILQHLVERAGRIVSKQALMDVAWKDAHVSETSLTEAIGLIRQALADDPQKPEYIQTVHRRGYRFIAAIATEAPSAAPALPERPVPGEQAPGAPEPRPAERRVAPVRSSRSTALVLAVAALVVAAVSFAAWILFRPAGGERVLRVNVALPPGQSPVPGSSAHPVVTLSPDGERFVYVGGPPSKPQLFLRELDRFDATALAGTEGAHGPFFSPDGDWVAFFAGGSLKKIRVGGGAPAAPQVLCATPTGVGGAWLSSDEIVFTPDWTGPLMRVSASGGQPSIAATPPAGRNYRWPTRLDDRTVLATRWRSTADDAAIVALTVPAGAEQVIAERATFGRYAPNGYVVFLRDGDVYAVNVDRKTFRPVGTPARVLPGVLTGMTGAAQFAMSPAGSLLYIPDVPERSQRSLARLDADGRSRDLAIAPRAFRYIAVCGNRIAVTVFERGQTDLWAGHLDRAALTRITREGSAFQPIWSPDCRSIAFSWNRTGVSNIYTVPVDSGDAPRVLFESRFPAAPGSWSRDGRWLSYVEQSETSGDVWLLDRPTGHRRPVVVTPELELIPRLSPDARHVAYETSVNGMFEVEVADIQTGARTQVSTGGGAWPAWSRDGKQLFFLHDTSIMRVDFRTAGGGQPAPTNPVTVFSHPDIILFWLADDQIVWLRRTAESVPLSRMNLVLNWFSELDREIR